MVRFENPMRVENAIADVNRIGDQDVAGGILDERGILIGDAIPASRIRFRRRQISCHFGERRLSRIELPHLVDRRFRVGKAAIRNRLPRVDETAIDSSPPDACFDLSVAFSRKLGPFGGSRGHDRRRRCRLRKIGRLGGFSLLSS